MVVYVILLVTFGCASPINRFTHKLVTFISSLLVPCFNAPLIFTRNGFFQSIPDDFPFTITSAKFFKSLKVSHNSASLANQSAEAMAFFTDNKPVKGDAPCNVVKTDKYWPDVVSHNGKKILTDEDMANAGAKEKID